MGSGGSESLIKRPALGLDVFLIGLGQRVDETSWRVSCVDQAPPSGTDESNGEEEVSPTYQGCLPRRSCWAQWRLQEGPYRAV